MMRLPARIRRALRGLRERFRALFHKGRVEAELDEEIRFHLEREIERNLDAGISPREARRLARVRFGGVEATKERHRDARGTRWLEDLLQDLRYAGRTLRREPGFAVAVILTLALGIGANTAIFGLVQGILLEPLPFEDPGRLVKVRYRNPATGQQGGWLSVPDFFDLRERNESLAGLAAADWPLSFNLTGPATPERVRGARVTPNYFDLLGVDATHGRTFVPGDERRDGAPAAVLGHGLWRRRFGADPEVVGSTIDVGGVPHVVVGVLPAGIRMPTPAEVWTPLDVDPDEYGRRLNILQVVGRLGPGTGIEAARGEATAIARGLEREHPDTNQDLVFELIPLRRTIVGSVRTTLWSLMAAVGVLLLLACSNVANLFFARAVARRREIGVRAVLGAGRGRLVRQLLTESLTLAAVSGVAGLLVGRWGLALVKGLAPAGVPRLQGVGIDAPVVAFGLGLTVAIGFVFGLLPARAMTGTDPVRAIQGAMGGVGGDGGARWGGLSRGLLIVGQVAASAALLVGAGLLVRSYAVMQSVEPGFRTDGLLRVQVSLPDDRYGSDDDVLAFYDRVLDRVRSLQGVRSAAATSAIPLGGAARSTGYHVASGDRDGDTAQFRAVTPGYFRTMGIRLETGRAFTGRDDRRAAEVVVVNESLARREWPDGEAVGRRLSLHGRDGPWARVIGVVADVRHFGLDRDPMPTIYGSHPQRAWDTMDLVVAGDEPSSLVGAVREQVLSVDAEQPVHAVATMADLVDRASADRRFTMLVFVVFAVAAIGLAVVGIYGVVTYRVRRRTREVGVRIALGSSRRGVVGLLLREGLTRICVGLILGLALAVLGGHWMRSLLYGVAPHDPVTFVGVALLLLSLSTAAILEPARRAARLDPAATLRE